MSGPEDDLCDFVEEGVVEVVVAVVEEPGDEGVPEVGGDLGEGVGTVLGGPLQGLMEHFQGLEACDGEGIFNGVRRECNGFPTIH